MSVTKPSCCFAAGGGYYGLNSVGPAIWDYVERPRTVGQILDYVLAGYEVSLDECNTDVRVLLVEMAEAGLIAQAGQQ